MAQNKKEYDPNMRGVLFQNDKEGNEKRPDFTGPVVINGEEMRIAGWIRKSKDGKKFISIAISNKNLGKKAEPKTDAEALLGD